MVVSDGGLDETFLRSLHVDSYRSGCACVVNVVKVLDVVFGHEEKVRPIVGARTHECFV